MSRRRARGAIGGTRHWARGVTVATTLALLGGAAPAAAQTTFDVDANDDFWTPEEVIAAPGDTVRWSFDQAVLNNHNVLVRPPGGTPELLSSPQVAPGSSETAEYVIPAADGIYDYYCSLHGSPGLGMSGVIRVGNTGPGPIEPEHFPNPSEPPRVYEEGDNTRPKLGRVKARGIRNGVFLRFALSEPGKVRVTIRRRGERVRETLKGLGAGTHSKRVRDGSLDPGRYAVALQAIDKAGNRSPAARARVRIK